MVNVWSSRVSRIQAGLEDDEWDEQARTAFHSLELYPSSALLTKELALGSPS